MKTLKNFRLRREALEALRSEAERTGKTETAVIEDMLLWRRILNEDAEAAMQFMATKHGLPARKVVEVAVMKAAGISGDLPFDLPLAA